MSTNGSTDCDNTREPMISAAQIKPLRTVSADYAPTEELKARLAHLRQVRQPFYLTADEFEEILIWKLRGQLGRQRHIRRENTDEIIRTITNAALTITHANKDYELELRFGLLCVLRGVGVPVASAVLALVFPKDYGVIDFRGWRQIFGEERSSYTIADYKRYLRALRHLADELDWPVQEVDLAIWEYDRRFGKSPLIDT